MKRLAMIAMTGIMTLALGACGGNDAPPMPDVNTDDAIQMQAPQQAAQPAQDVTPAAPGTESEAVVATPAPAETTVAPTEAPTEGQMMGATAEE